MQALKPLRPKQHPDRAPLVVFLIFNLKSAAA